MNYLKLLEILPKGSRIKKRKIIRQNVKTNPFYSFKKGLLCYCSLHYVKG